MTQAHVERKYPELAGLPYDTQMGILGRARRGISWKHMLKIVIIAGVCMGGACGIAQRLLSLHESFSSICVLGVICGIISSFCYSKVFRQRIKELVEDERKGKVYVE